MLMGPSKQTGAGGNSKQHSSINVFQLFFIIFSQIEKLESNLTILGTHFHETETLLAKSTEKTPSGMAR
jgi:hypothetical protein